jgi:hypothetical protein
MCVGRYQHLLEKGEGRRGHDRMVDGLRIYHHKRFEFESRGVLGTTFDYVIKFVSDLRQVSGFLQVLRFPPPSKLTATI